VQEFHWLKSRLIAGVYLDASDNPYVSDNIYVVRDGVSGKYVRYQSADLSTPVGRNGRRDYQTDILNYAPFFQLELSPLTPLRIVLGGRYDAVEYDFTNNLTPSADYGAPNETRTFAHFSPKLGATYSFANAVSMYVNASEGFTAPDVSQLYGKSSIPDLKPATYRNYELGVRAAFFDGALKFDTAVYRLEGKDTIVSYADVPGNSVNKNAGKTLSEGIEFGALLEIDQFDARLGATWANHKYVQYSVGPAANQIYDGKEMPQAPSLMTAEVGYRPVQSLRIAVEGIRQGSYWMNNQNSVQYDGHTLLNVRGVFTYAKSWEVWVQGRNLTDELYSSSSSSSYNGTAPQTLAQANAQNQYTPGGPLTVTLGFTYTFGAK
jgi:iron complex outermembrane recepter protein